MMPPAVRALTCFALATALLGYAIDRTGIAAAYTDPVGHIRAQDESLYANAALTFAGGGWLTPRFLGRYVLVKPPLLHWLAGLSLRVAGVSLWALRLPVLVAAAYAVCILFAWVQRSRSAGAAWVAMLLLVSDPLWHVLSRICYTDILAAAAIATAFAVIQREPRLGSGTAAIAFGAALAAGVMAKSVAGLLPLLALGPYWLLSSPELRPSMTRVAQAVATMVVLAAPWHVYQLAVHRQWFWMDYVRVQLLGFGVHPAEQHAAAGPVYFYARGLWLTDPVLCVLAVAALPGFVAAVRARRPDALLLLSWIAVAACSLVAFRYRNLPYLLCLVAPLCVLAASFMPLRRAGPVIVLLAGIFIIRAAFPSRPWGLPFGAAQQPSAAALREYSDRNRANELIVVDPDDDFYSATLPLARVRYCFVDPGHLAEREAPHYAWLGIIVTPDQFADPARWNPVFRSRLREWGLDSIEPVGTAILADSDPAVVAMVRDHPDSDFFLPARFQHSAQARFQARQIVPAESGRFFLLAQGRPGVIYHRPAWVLPRNW
jgi:hypothetical protein